MPRKGQFRKDVGYLRRHERVHEARGKASDHLCVDCGLQAQEWAQVHDTDGYDVYEHYQSRCCSCHQKYDNHWNEVTRAKVSESTKRAWASDPDRKKFSDEHKANMRAAWVRRKARNKNGGEK